MRIYISTAEQQFRYLTRGGEEAIVLVDLRHFLDGKANAAISFPLCGAILNKDGSLHEWVTWTDKGRFGIDGMRGHYDLVSRVLTEGDRDSELSSSLDEELDEAKKRLDTIRKRAEDALRAEQAETEKRLKALKEHINNAL